MVMIGGLGTVIFSAVVVVVTFVVVVCFVVAFGFAVVVPLVVMVAALVVVITDVCVICIVVVSLGCSVIGAAVVVIAVVALTGSYCANTGLLSVGCVVSRLVRSVADVGAVCVVVALVVVVTAGVCVVVRRLVVVLLSVVVTLPDGFSLSVEVIADDEVVVTTSALGSVICAQPDSRAASISIAIAFFIGSPPFQQYHTRRRIAITNVDRLFFADLCKGCTQT